MPDSTSFHVVTIHRVYNNYDTTYLEIGPDDMAEDRISIRQFDKDGIALTTGMTFSPKQAKIVGKVLANAADHTWVDKSLSESTDNT